MSTPSANPNNGSSGPTFDESVELLRRAKGGDEGALGQLLEHYRGRLLHRIRVLLGKEARRGTDSEDFVQSVFAIGLEKFVPGRIRDEDHFVNWLARIAQNRIRDEARKRCEPRFGSVSKHFEDCAGDAKEPTPSAELSTAERREAVRGALDGLQPSYREVLELRMFQGLGLREIAARLGKSEAAVRMLHTRALVRLGKVLGKDWDTDERP